MAPSSIYVWANVMKIIVIGMKTIGKSQITMTEKLSLQQHEAHIIANLLGNY